MVFLCELNCSDIIQHGQALFHLFKNNGQVVHAFRICSFESNCFKQQKQQFDISLYGVFQPPNILTAPPNRLPPDKIPHSPNKKFFALSKSKIVLGQLSKLNTPLHKHCILDSIKLGIRLAPFINIYVVNTNLSSRFSLKSLQPLLPFFRYLQSSQKEKRSCLNVYNLILQNLCVNNTGAVSYTVSWQYSHNSDDPVGSQKNIKIIFG